MSDNTNQESQGVDWSRVEDRMKSKEDAGRQPEPGGTLVRVEGSPSLAADPLPLAVQLPDTEAPRGILMQWRANKIDRKTALQAMQAQHDAQLDTLRYQLQKAVSVSNARADHIADVFLEKLDSERLQVLKDLGLRNAETRASALIQVRAMIVAKLQEVQGKNWPQQLLNRTIDDLLDLDRRVSSEMLKELGD
jgi:hypothetical protein